MSNDKTTLADVQPGGKVRLGNQTERAEFAAPPAQTALEAKCAWIVGDARGTRWRMCGGTTDPNWTNDRDQALHFARESDAEAYAAESSRLYGKCTAQEVRNG
ncbi:hypothetical protein [Stenotrophomonas maltophilia]|uniref:hypothetical protein n=1 Tax=Stenotrophomonas maltophilia TaxID=40324 RepID=UPI003D7C7D97